ncbi:MAG: ABC transporter substrate-binding protein [bacterium]
MRLSAAYRRIGAAVVVTTCLVGLTVAPALAEIASPTDFVNSMADEILVVLNTPELDSKAQIQAIETIAARRFHFPSIARLVAARNWRRLNTDEKRIFSAEFQKHLSVTYSRNIDRFDNQTIEITSDREESRGDWTVKTRIIQSSGENILVDYRLRQVKGQWRVIDVVVEHISLVANFRSQIQELFSKKGVTGTLAFLAEKNANGASMLPADQALPGS